MNGIEQIRKANELSRVLKNHGLAQDSFEAIKKAHQMINKEKSPVLDVEPSNIKQEVSTINNDSINHKLHSFERSKYLLNERMDKFSIMFEQLQEENKSLRARLEAMESRVKFLSRDAGAASSTTNPPVTTASDPSLNSQQSQIHNQNSPVHDNARGSTTAQLSATPQRSSSANSPGNHGIDPASVSIENIFYCGTK